MKNLRLYSPLKVTTFMYDEEEMCYSDYAEEVYNDVEYYEDIKEALKVYQQDENDETVERGLMEYFYDDEKEIYKSINEKVESAVAGVTVLRLDGKDKMFGVCDLKLKEDLTSDEINVLYEYLTGQYADGMGEGFEQQNIDVNIYSEERQINAHLWNYNDFYIKAETEVLEEGYLDLYPPKCDEVVNEQSQSEENNITMDM